MDQKTASAIKNEFLNSLKAQLKKVEVAKEEDLFAVGIDLFRVPGK